MDIVGYILGVAAHVGFKWGSWKTSKRAWRDYWTEYAGLNVAAGIAAIVCFGLWGSGAIPSVLGTIANGAAAMVGHTEPVQIPHGFWGSMMAGYVMDSIARTLWIKLDRKVDVGGDDDK